MMKSCCSIIAVVFSPTILFAQFSSSISAVSQPGIKGHGETAVLIGKLATQGDSRLSEPGNVVLECANQVRAHDYSDANGNFSLTVSVSDDTPANRALEAKTPTVAREEWFNCELYADVAAYRSERLRLTERPGGVTQVGTIMLHPLTADRNFVVSVGSLAAPDKAKKEFDKGQEQERNGKWSAACDSFKKAIAAYPRYALAWLELGRSQVRQNSFVEAQQSFHQAIMQDSRLVDGYVELAHLALKQQNWRDLADVTDRLVQVSPDSSPEPWFLNSAANYNLGNLQQAEKGIVRGLHIDTKHQIVQMEYLYGLILAAKKDYKSAAEHVSTYVRVASNSKDVEGARKVLADFQQKAQIAEANKP